MAKHTTSKLKNSSLTDLALGLVALAGTYGFGSWAIDSGSLWHYALAFASFYYAIHFLKQAINTWLKNNGKRKTARRAKS